jgi:hypothetical protein
MKSVRLDFWGKIPRFSRLVMNGLDWCSENRVGKSAPQFIIFLKNKIHVSFIVLVSERGKLNIVQEDIVGLKIEVTILYRSIPLSSDI